MPILKEERCLFPETLLDEPPSDAAERHWFALYTKARQEKSLARELLQHRVPFYLPLVRKTSVSRGRKRTSQVPLFGGYVFLFGSEEERVAQSGDESDFPHSDGGRRPAVGVRSAATPSNDRRQCPADGRKPSGAGQRVRVHQGAFAGLEGTILKRRGETRLLVSINFLQQGASVEIDDFSLEPLD